MKKILALLAVVLGVVSCQTEPEGLDVNVGGEQEVAICVTIPETETRAGGLNSALGVFDNGILTTTDATMRYILQVYYKTTENGEAKYTASKERLVKYSDGKSVTFPVRLVPNRDYQFVVWADVVDRDNAGDKHYNTVDLANVQLNRTWFAMDETRDAFTATQLVENYNSTSSINIILKRPFAKLRVVTTDMVALNNLGIQPKNATVTYSVDHYNAFNALAGNAIGDSKNRTIKHENFVIASYGEDVVAGANMTLFTDYFFAEAGDVVKFELNVFDQNGVSIKKNNFNTDIAVQRNYLTTIAGNILTDGNNVKVTVEDAFENVDNNGNTTNPNYDYKTISSEAEFFAAVNSTTGGQYILISDIDVDGVYASTNAATRTSINKTVNINLNGKTITVNNDGTDALISLADGAALIFSGEGDIIGSGKLAGDDANVVVTDAVTVASGVTGVKTGIDALVYICKNGGEFTFASNLKAEEIVVVNTTNPVVINGNGKTLTSTAGRAINVSGATNVTIKNLNIVASGERAINIIQNATNITIDNVTATAANYTVNVASSAPNAVVAIKNSTLNGLCTVNVSSVGAVVTVDGSTVNCNDNNTTAGEAYAALSLNTEAVGGKIIATNTTINVAEGSDSLVARNGAEDGVVTIDGSDEDVAFMYAVITYPGPYYHSFATIAKAVEFAKNGDVITLIRNVELTEPLVIDGKTITLDLNGKTITGTGSYALIINEGKLTITGGELDVITCDKKIDEGLYKYKNGDEYLVMNAEGLATLNTMMANKTAGKNVVVKLAADIDFTGKTWTLVDSHADTAFWLTEIDGQGHTISNLTINGQAMFRRFAGVGDVTIKDITFDNANVNSNGTINTSILTVQSYQNVLLDNVDVKNSTIIGGYKVAPLIATVYNESPSTITATLKNCDVENVTVKATSYDFCTTGMVAFVNAGNNDTIEFENCSVKNVKLYAPNVYKAHAAIYTEGSETLYNEADGVVVENVTFKNI